MTRYEFLQLLAPRITNELVITNLGGVAREWYHLKHREGNLYYPNLAHCTPIALGLALALPKRRVIALDGDGSMLFGLTILPVVADQNPSNLIVFVFDNQCYEAPGGVPSFTAGGTDLAAMARGAGIRNSRLVRERAEFEKAVEEAYHADGASFIAVKVEMEISPKRFPFARQDGTENKYYFVRYIEKTENIEVIKPAAKALPKEKMTTTFYVSPSTSEPPK